MPKMRMFNMDNSTLKQRAERLRENIDCVKNQYDFADPTCPDEYRSAMNNMFFETETLLRVMENFPDRRQDGKDGSVGYNCCRAEVLKLIGGG